MLSDWVAAAIGAAAAIAGGVLGARGQRKEASKLRDWQAQQYAQRYQVTMNDMRAAGLNPMLAYSQGPGQAPSGTAGNIGDYGGGAAGNVIAQGGIRNAQEKQSREQANLAATTELKTKEEVATAKQQARKAKMEADDYEKYGRGPAADLLITGERSGRRTGRNIKRWRRKPAPTRKTRVEVLRSLKRHPKIRKPPPIPKPFHPKWR